MNKRKPFFGGAGAAAPLSAWVREQTRTHPSSLIVQSPFIHSIPQHSISCLRKKRIGGRSPFPFSFTLFSSRSRCAWYVVHFYLSLKHLRQTDTQVERSLLSGHFTLFHSRTVTHYYHCISAFHSSTCGLPFIHFIQSLTHSCCRSAQSRATHFEICKIQTSVKLVNPVLERLRIVFLLSITLLQFACKQVLLCPLPNFLIRSLGVAQPSTTSSSSVGSP